MYSINQFCSVYPFVISINTISIFVTIFVKFKNKSNTSRKIFIEDRRESEREKERDTDRDR